WELMERFQETSDAPRRQVELHPRSRNAKPSTSRKAMSDAASHIKKPSGAHGPPSTRRPAAERRAAPAAARKEATRPRASADVSAAARPRTARPLPVPGPPRKHRRPAN